MGLSGLALRKHLTCSVNNLHLRRYCYREFKQIQQVLLDQNNIPTSLLFWTLPDLSDTCIRRSVNENAMFRRLKFGELESGDVQNVGFHERLIAPDLFRTFSGCGIFDVLNKALDLPRNTRVSE